MQTKTKTRVRETISHGDFQQDRYENVDLNDISSVIKLLNSCSYLLMPEPDFAEGCAMVSHTYEECVAGRLKDAKRVARELLKSGESEIGWVTYVVLD